jgi:uncharacterized protein (TIGR02246 family)
MINNAWLVVAIPVTRAWMMSPHCSRIDLVILAGSPATTIGSWNDADGAAFGEAFLDDAEFVDIRGSHHRGRAAIGHGHQAIFDSIYARSNVRYKVDVAHAISPGCFLAVASATLDAPLARSKESTSPGSPSPSSNTATAGRSPGSTTPSSPRRTDGLPHHF